MKRPLILAAIALTAAVIGCGGDDDSDDGDTAGTAAPAKPAAKPAAEKKAKDEAPAAAARPTGLTVQVADSDFGQILFDADDQAIYLFDKESTPRSECYGACAEAWPPVLTEGAPRAGSGLQGSLLGTTKRSDGSTQVTYNGHPLYYYVDDPPGQVLCHNVEEFGGLWLVVDSAGDAVQ